MEHETRVAILARENRVWLAVFTTCWSILYWETLKHCGHSRMTPCEL